MAIVSIGVYLGQFLSPVILKFAGKFFGNDAFRSQFIFLAMGLGFATLIGLFSAIKAVKRGDFNSDLAVKGGVHH
jgi:hypothetical protein